MHGVLPEKRSQHSHHHYSIFVHLLCYWSAAFPSKWIHAQLHLFNCQKSFIHDYTSHVSYSRFWNPGHFACGIRNSGLWNPNFSSRNSESPNPSSSDKESTIQYLESGNPMLSWITLHGTRLRNWATSAKILVPIHGFLRSSIVQTLWRAIYGRSTSMGKLLVEISVGYPIACSRRSDSGERCEVKRSAKKIKAREGSPSTFYRYLYFAPLSTIWTLGTG